MRLSELFTKTTRKNPSDEVSLNAILLERGGYIYKNSAGVYSFLPLGWCVIEKIRTIIREEMNAIGGQEMFMPALVDRRYYEATGRAGVDIIFEAKGLAEKKANFVIGWTHEEVLGEIAQRYIDSYKDLPFAAYQIQTKFRNEPRAKSGLLRSREFMMKDLYSFHEDEKDMYAFYEKAKNAYDKVFSRCGLKTYYTLAGGGEFTLSNTHEFQVLSEVGEDIIFVCDRCRTAVNQEVIDQIEGRLCPQCHGPLREEKAIEVGNIFPLGTKYSQAFNLKYTDKSGQSKFVVMGSYGIGLSRVMGAIVEVSHDKDGIVWPATVAPFAYHLVALEGVTKEADEIYQKLIDGGAEVLFDDRDDKSAGEKFADADLIGVPTRIIVSKKNLSEQKLEIVKRADKSVDYLKLTELSNLL